MKRWVSFIVSVFLVFSCASMDVFAVDEEQVRSTDPVADTVEDGEITIEDREKKEQTEVSAGVAEDQDIDSTDEENGKIEEQNQIKDASEKNVNPEEPTEEDSDSEMTLDEIVGDTSLVLDNTDSEGQTNTGTEPENENGVSDEEKDDVDSEATDVDSFLMDKSEQSFTITASSNSIELYSAPSGNQLQINLNDYTDRGIDNIFHFSNGCNCSESNPHVINGSTSFVGGLNLISHDDDVMPVSFDVDSGTHYILLKNGVVMDERDTTNSAIDVNGGELHLLFEGNVTIYGGDEGSDAHPAIYVSNGAALYLEGTGTLNLNGVDDGASGISGDGTVIIKSGTINAAGGGDDGTGFDVKTLTVDGGNVIAKGTRGGAGIHTNDGYSLTVNGGYVTATGSSDIAGAGENGSAGIGGNVGRLIGGNDSSFGDITITGGNVTAIGGPGGAGIGSGYVYLRSDISGNVTVTGGKVIAKGSSGSSIAGSGIGTGSNGNFTGSVNLNGGLIYAAGSSGSGPLGENAPSIGAGGKQIGQSGHGSLSIDGFVAVIAPDGLGDTSSIQNWNGIIANGSYYDPSTGNYITQDLTEGAILLADEGFTLSSGVSNVVGNVTVPDGQSITVNSGATLNVRGSGNYLKDFNNDDSSISLNNPSTLNFEYSAKLIGNGGTINSAGVTEFHGGVDQVIGSGNLNEVYQGKVKILLTDDLVSQDWNNVVFDNTDHASAITVKVENLWSTYTYVYSPYDDYYFNSRSSFINAGIYTASVEVRSTDNSRLLERSTSVNVNFVIEKHDFTVNMPSQWTLEKGLSNLLSRLPELNSNEPISGQDVNPIVKNNYNFDTLKAGTINWYEDVDCKIKLTEDKLVSYANAGTNVDVYWSYTHNDLNFVSPKTGKVTLSFSDRPVLTVNIFHDSTNVTNGTVSGVYGDSINLSVELVRDGTPVTTLPNDGKWESDKPYVLVSQDGTLQLIDVPTDSSEKVTITYKVPEHDEVDDNHGASQAVVYVTIQPKTINLSGVELVDRNYEAGNTMVEVNESSLTIPESQLVAGDEGKVQVEVSGKVDLSSDKVGEYTNVVIDTLSLTGDKAHCYKLAEIVDPIVTIKAVQNETSDDNDKTESNTGTWDDGGPFTTDECGSVYDRWGNLIYQGVCGVTTGFHLVNTLDK